MKTNEVKVVLLPWYSADDFVGADGGREERRYERWRAAARKEIEDHLAAGYAVELVSVRLGDFRGWLEERRQTDCLATRLDYIRSARASKAADILVPHRMALAQSERHAATTAFPIN